MRKGAIGLRRHVFVAAVVSLAVLLGFVAAGSVPTVAWAATKFRSAPTPTIAGTVRVGSKLTAKPGTWKPTASLTYRWKLSGTSVSGATKPTWVIPASAKGKTITVTVTGSRRGYKTTAKTSKPTGKVAAGMFTAPTPTISGTAKVGQTLTAKPGTWKPAATLTYQWYRAGKPISRATKSTYALVPADAGNTITVRVTGKLSGYTSQTKTSAATAKVGTGVFAVTPTPTISGVPQAGKTFVVNVGTWSPVPSSFSYQWFRSGVKITGATAASYALTDADAGSTITVQVTGTLAGLSSTTVTSASSGVVVRADFDGILITQASPVGLGARLAWTPDTDDSATLTKYRLAATPQNGQSTTDCPTPTTVTDEVDASNSGTVVTGLCAGVVYTFTATPVLSTGTAITSAPSAAVVPFTAQVPDAVLVTGVLGRAKSLVVGWNAPDYDGGAAITGYHVSAQTSAGAIVATTTAAADATTVTLTGLVNGTDYTVTVAASNRIGDSTPGTETGTPSAAYAPTAPATIQAVPNGSGAVVVSWSAPTDDGGSAVIGYTITWQQATLADDGSWAPSNGSTPHTATVAAGAIQATITDFEAPTAGYLFTVAANNSAGTGATAATNNGVTPTLQLASHTVVLNQATTDALTAATDAALTWPTPASAQVTSLTVGQVIVLPYTALLGSAQLRTVSKIVTSGGVVTVSTTPATLQEAFDNLTMDASANLQNAAASQTPPTGAQSLKQAQAQFRPAVAGVQASRIQTNGAATGATFTKTFALDVQRDGTKCNAGKTSCAHWQVDSALSISPQVGVSLGVTQNAIGIPNGASATAYTKITGQDRISASGAIQQTIHLGILKAPAPIVFSIGPIPFTLQPNIPVDLKITGEGSVTISASMTLGGQVSWTSQHPTKLSPKNLWQPPHLEPGIGDSPIQVTAEITVDLIVTAQVTVDGGFNVGLEADLDLDVNFAPGHDPWLTVDPRLTISARANISLFNHTVGNLTIQLTATSLPKIELHGTPPPSYTITVPFAELSPGGSETLTAIRSDGASKPLTWSLKNGANGDFISGRGVLTISGTAKSNRGVYVSVKDTDGRIGTAYIYIGSTMSAPTDLVVKSSNSGTVTLDWQAVTGAVGYKIVTQPKIATQTVRGATATLTGLTASTEYTTRVYAVSAAGTASDPASLSYTLDSAGVVQPGNDITHQIITATGRYEVFGRGTRGPDGRLWFKFGAEDGGGDGVVGIDPKTHSTELLRYGAADMISCGDGSSPAFDGAGDLWISGCGSHIEKIAPNGARKTFSFTTPEGRPANLVIAEIVGSPDGSVWFLGSDLADLYHIQADGEMKSITAPSGYGFYGDLTANSSGDLWLVMDDANGGRSLAKATPSGDVETIPTLDPEVLGGILGLHDGTLWLTTMYPSSLCHQICMISYGTTTQVLGSPIRDFSDGSDFVFAGDWIWSPNWSVDGGGAAAYNVITGRWVMTSLPEEMSDFDDFIVADDGSVWQPFDTWDGPEWIRYQMT